MKLKYERKVRRKHERETENRKYKDGYLDYDDRCSLVTENFMEFAQVPDQ